jgi:UDP-N-acetyl-D-galactosamine dehydrogenase
VADADKAKHEYVVTLSPWDELPQADAIVMAVAHDGYANMDIKRLLTKVVDGGCFIDVKSSD